MSVLAALILYGGQCLMIGWLAVRRRRAERMRKVSEESLHLAVELCSMWSSMAMRLANEDMERRRRLMGGTAFLNTKEPN